MDKLHSIKLYYAKKYIITFIFCGIVFFIPLFLFILGNVKREWKILDFGSDSDAIYAITIFAGLFLMCILCVVVCYVRAATKFGDAMLIQYQKQTGESTLLNANFDLFFTTKEIVNGVWISDEFIAGIYNTTTIFRKTDDLIWIYPVYTDVSTIDIGAAVALKLSKSPAYLKLHFKDRKCYTIQLRNQSDVDTVLRYIKELRSDIVTIYTPELEESYIRKEYPFEV